MKHEDRRKLLTEIEKQTGLYLTIEGVQKVSDMFRAAQIESDLKEPEKPKPIDGNYGSFNVAGLGPDAKVVTNEKGGSQSANPYAAECVPPLAFARMVKVLAEGKAKYGRNNWTKITDPLDHTGKAIMHIMAYHAGDMQEGKPEEHLAHSICRLMFALDVIERDKQVQPSLKSSSVVSSGTDRTNEVRFKHPNLYLATINDNDIFVEKREDGRFYDVLGTKISDLHPIRIASIHEIEDYQTGKQRIVTPTKQYAVAGVPDGKGGMKKISLTQNEDTGLWEQG